MGIESFKKINDFYWKIIWRFIVMLEYMNNKCESIRNILESRNFELK